MLILVTKTNRYLRAKAPFRRLFHYTEAVVFVYLFTYLFSYLFWVFSHRLSLGIFVLCSFPPPVDGLPDDVSLKGDDWRGEE